MLQQAIQSGDFAKAKELLSQGESLPDDLQDYQRTSLFDKLIKDKGFDIIELLIEKGVIETDIYEYDSFNKTIFASIVKYLDEEQESVDFLNTFIPQLQSLNDELEGKSLLSYAVEAEVGIEIIKTLVAQGCDINITTSAEENLIHQITKKYVRTYDQGLQYLEFFIAEGLDIDQPNIVGKTPLILAVEFHKNEYMQFLMEHGADANVVDKDGNSAFFIAVANAVDYDKYMMMREYAIPQFDHANNRGETLLFECIRMISSINDKNTNLVKTLIEDGADLYQESTYYQAQLTAIDVLAKKPADLLKVVLDLGVLEINRKDDGGNTILHKVCDHDSNHEQHVAKETYRKVKLLLAAGAETNATNSNEETPMMLASKDNLKTKTVELLLTHN